MRTLSQPSSALRHPLDAILGTPAAIRTLRVLANHGGALPSSMIADRAQINRSGAGRTLAHLCKVRIVEVVGMGRYVSYRFNPKHPLGPTINALFEAERYRVDSIYKAVRQAAEAISPSPIAVWLFGSGARGEDTVESDLDIALVGVDGHDGTQADALRDALFTAGEEWAFQPSVISMSRTDVERMRKDNTAFWQNLCRDAVPLFGAAPEQVAHG